jgi:pimeloyl-ACP methyl ester carboxylesterase
MTHKTLRSSTQRLQAILLLFGIMLMVAYIVLIPWNISNLSSHPNPVQNYEEALERIAQLEAQEAASMNPVCRLQLMTHGKKAHKAIILVHGITNCPQQFNELGQRFYDIGYNVLIAPLPHHGLADRMTEEHSLLKAEELAIYADETVDITQGLGDQVIMMGFSAGGVTTAWAAQNRKDLDLAVIISPGFGFKQIPTPLTAAVMNIYMLLPDSLVWWDPVLQTNTIPAYAYPRYSKHALVQTLRLGFAVQVDAKSSKPAAQKIVVVFNPTDEAVNNLLTRAVVGSWQAHGANLTTFEFAENLQLPHDLIDPSQPYQQIDVVYPRLMELTNP